MKKITNKITTEYWAGSLIATDHIELAAQKTKA